MSKSKGKSDLPKNHSPGQLPDGYFKSPDFIFDLNLTHYAKLIFLNLCRRADKAGISFPSLDRIGRDCGIKSRTTVSKALNELYQADLVAKDNSDGTHNTYRLSKKILSIIRTCSSGEHPNPCEPDQPVHEMDTKEYTYKENTHKESMCVLSNEQLEQITREWIHTFQERYGQQPAESPKGIHKNISIIAQKVSEKLPKGNTDDVYNHCLGLVKWYLSVDEDSGPSKGNGWVYRGGRKSSRLAKNFDTVWSDYWSVHEPVKEWKPLRGDRKDCASEDQVKNAFESLDFYKKHKERNRHYAN